MAKKRKTLPREIRELLKAGDVEALKEMFSRCEPNAVNSLDENIFFYTPLPREFAFWAKEQGADVNFQNRYLNVPIYRQAETPNGDVQLMIDLGADFRVVDYTGWTLLHRAAVHGCVENVKTLLRAGLEVDAEAKKFEGCRTPLEMMLYKDNLTIEKYLTISRLLLDAGARLTDTSCEYVRRIAENFRRIERRGSDEDYICRQAEALPKLCALFGVEVPGEVPFHDGVSPIVITETEYPAQFKKLWEYLIPPSGCAQTAQGEVIRIAGRVDDELMRNGGGNWDGSYRKMLQIFPEYLRLGNPLPEEDVAGAERLTKLLQSGRVIGDGENSGALCRLAVKWVLQNPEVISPLEGDYNR